MRLSVTFSITVLGFLSFVSSFPTLNKRDPKLSPLLYLVPGDSFDTVQLITSPILRRMAAVYVSETHVLYLPFNHRSDNQQEIPKSTIGITTVWRTDTGSPYSWFSRDTLVYSERGVLRGIKYEQRLQETELESLIKYLKKNREKYTIFFSDGKLEKSEADELFELLGKEIVPPPFLLDPRLSSSPSTVQRPGPFPLVGPLKELPDIGNRLPSGPSSGPTELPPSLNRRIAKGGGPTLSPLLLPLPNGPSPFKVDVTSHPKGAQRQGFLV